MEGSESLKAAVTKPANEAITKATIPNIGVALTHDEMK